MEGSTCNAGCHALSVTAKTALQLQHGEKGSPAGKKGAGSTHALQLTVCGSGNSSVAHST